VFGVREGAIIEAQSGVGHLEDIGRIERLVQVRGRHRILASVHDRHELRSGGLERDLERLRRVDGDCAAPSLHSLDVEAATLGRIDADAPRLAFNDFTQRVLVWNKSASANCSLVENRLTWYQLVP